MTNTLDNGNFKDKKQKKKKSKKKLDKLKAFDAKGKFDALLDQAAVDYPEVYKSDSGESKYSNEDKT